jgi:hypothetical protein
MMFSTFLYISSYFYLLSIKNKNKLEVNPEFRREAAFDPGIYQPDRKQEPALS